MSYIKPYDGSDVIYVGNKNSISQWCAHVTIYEGSKLNLKDVLVISKLKKNFLSIEKFTSNNSWLLNLPDLVLLLWIETTSMKIRKDNTLIQKNSTSSYWNKGGFSLYIWHQQLEHLNSKLLSL